MIFGIGHDLVEIERVGRLLAGKSAERFLDRILTVREREAMRARPGREQEFAAGRFAAKEAIAKAFGCGIGATLGFGDMAIVPAEGGRPAAELSEAAWTRLGLEPGRCAVHLTITHERQMASAFCVVEVKRGD
ncbi:holo-[acyl-carrier-protein] synthase [Paenibacillus spiritus]|uniref:Holo-[acyl-carrier-protein] synthase n=1 Tax=Paenibacillus spiritus TaxID=2496557 RepID=A0A5J5FUP9_9BACL|nr:MULTISPECIES: holo-ACP synthase [Paenibacillus]KAA8997163.1 holo-[acyl-carrier-protein] synthase [Paenibacillus spiritus]